MKFTGFLRERFQAASPNDAMVWCGRSYSYEALLNEIEKWDGKLRAFGLPACSVVSLEADFSPNAVALWISLMDHGCTVVPLTSSVVPKKEEFLKAAEVEVSIKLGANDKVSVEPTGFYAKHPLLITLKAKKHPGLILFSSGSTGKSKAALHDFVPLLEKFKLPRHSYRTIAFLLFDHIGGINTLFYTLANSGCLISLTDRNPAKVCESIEKHRAQILPTSPTFLNLLILSEAYRKFDLSSLQLVTYGTEVMSEITLKRFHELFPNIRLLQTYGLSELGILRSKSKSSDSLWVKIGGEGFETRVREGLLEIKAKSAMLGYLNAPSPFTQDGWFMTGDAVEVDGEYLKILGRKSELINVGGEKVYPAEVESVIQEMPGVEEAVIRGEKSPLLGNMVHLSVKINTSESLFEFIKRMRAFCQGKLAPFKIPQKVTLEQEALHGERFKKMRVKA